MTNATKVEVIKEPITINEEKGLYVAQYQKVDKKTGKTTLSLELRQKLTTLSYYPSIKIANEQSASLFALEDFGLDTTPYKSEETRVAWINVPGTATMEQAKAMLVIAQKNGAEIYRVLSFAPIIGEDQQYAIDNGLRTLDDYADQQAMRFPENETTIADGTANTLILDRVTGNVQYRKTFFWDKPRKDEDLRKADNVYVSPKLATELEGAMTFSGQQVN